jgi:glycogen synthase
LKVLMFGWEFPPIMTGGLGTVCYSLTRALAKKGHQVTFVMPTGPKDLKGEFVNLIVANNIEYTHLKIKTVDSLLTPYLSFDGYSEVYKKFIETKDGAVKALYGSNLYQEVYRFSELAKVIAQNEEFDIIHCHDWMTVDAAINAKKVSGKPIVMHIHNTIFDRGAGFGSPYEYEIEKRGFEQADRVIAISNRIKEILVTKYFINPDKIEVIHWGIDQDNPAYKLNYKSPFSFDNSKIVLFLGRITIQKGPDYFVEAAKKVLQFEPSAKFIFVGSGDMEPQIIRRVAELGIGNSVIFSGFAKGADVHKAFQMADVYVMPSVSEPFGVVALESMINKTPVIISKQSGASEVIRNGLKVDFWDVDELTNKIVGVLKYVPLHKELTEQGLQEVKQYTYEETADRVVAVYNSLMPAIVS